MLVETEFTEDSFEFENETSNDMEKQLKKDMIIGQKSLLPDLTGRTCNNRSEISAYEKTMKPMVT